jgi:hypothetical protein
LRRSVFIVCSIRGGVEHRRERRQCEAQAPGRQVAEAQPEDAVAVSEPRAGRQLELVRGQQVPEPRDPGCVEPIGAKAQAAQRTAIRTNPSTTARDVLTPLGFCAGARCTRRSKAWRCIYEAHRTPLARTAANEKIQALLGVRVDAVERRRVRARESRLVDCNDRFGREGRAWAAEGAKRAAARSGATSKARDKAIGRPRVAGTVESGVTVEADDRCSVACV